MPPEQALALAVEDSPVFVAGGARCARLACSSTRTRSGRRHARRRCAVLGRSSSVPVLRHRDVLPPRLSAPIWCPSWLPALDGVVREARAGAKVADVGCGHGASTLIMAQAFPNSASSASTSTRRRFTAARASARRSRRRRAGRVHARRAPRTSRAATSIWCASSTACTTWATPSARRGGLIRRCAAMARVLLVEPFANDVSRTTCNPVGRLFYAASTFICTPNSLSQEVGPAASVRRPAKRACATSSRGRLPRASGAPPRRRST